MELIPGALRTKSMSEFGQPRLATAFIFERAGAARMKVRLLEGT